MKVLIVTDAWEPQVNGVVRTYQNTLKHIHGAEIIHPYTLGLKRVPMPGYNEIELVTNPWIIKRLLWVAMYENRKIHIATEGPLGLYTRNLLNKCHYRYTTSFHTMFPEYIEKRFKIPASFIYPFFRWFHGKSKKVLVPTISMKNFLEEKKFKNVKVWTRGVDTKIFNPTRRQETKPYIVCVSRLSKEKGLDDFCKLKYDRKVLIGDGPYYEELRQKYPDVEMIGKREGVDLAKWIASADAFVFPSKTDTFGIVILESLACGTPVAAYDQPGPRETIFNGVNGYYGEDLTMSLVMCLTLNRDEVHKSSQNWTWERATQQFLDSLND